MDLLDFVASIVSSVAWPVVVLALFLIFRTQVRKFIDEFANRAARLQRVKGAWGEAEWFEETLGELSDQIKGHRVAGARKTPDPTEEPAHSLKPTPGVPKDTSRQTDSPNDRSDDDASEDDIAMKLAQIQPAAGVLAAFIELERDLGRYLNFLGVNWSSSAVVAMNRTHTFPSEMRSLINTLSRLRNAVAHGDSGVTLDLANHYIEAANDISQQLRRLTSEEK